MNIVSPIIAYNLLSLGDTSYTGWTVQHIKGIVHCVANGNSILV